MRSKNRTYNALTDSAKLRLQSARNRRRGIRTLKAVFFLLLLGGLCTWAYLFGSSERFSLRQVAFHGNRHLSDAKLRDIGGIRDGENLFALSAAEKALRLMESPWIKEVSIRKEFPQKLLVKIDEAVPQALLKRKDELYLIDSEGKVLEQMSSRNEYFLPVIISSGNEESRAFSEALVLAGTIRDMDIMSKAKHVEITGFERGVEDLSMSIDGLLVVMGEGRYEEKLKMLQELSQEIQTRMSDIEFYVDMRFSDRVVVKPVSIRGTIGQKGGA